MKQRAHTAAEPAQEPLPLPVPTPRREGEAPPPLSEDAFARRALRVWVGRAMAVCLVLLVVLFGAIPILGAFRVKSVSAAGHVHYTAEELVDAAGIDPGTQLLALSPPDIRAALLAACPYLADVSVERTLGGHVTLLATERTPAWALGTEDGQVAVLDAAMHILELGPATAQPDTCRVLLTLFVPPEPSEDEEGEPQPQDTSLTPGTTYEGNPEAIAHLKALSTALAEVELPARATELDLRDPYAATLTLADGTVFYLHECRAPQRQLSEGIAALTAYRTSTGQTGPTVVDIPTEGQISLRPAN